MHFLGKNPRQKGYVEVLFIFSEILSILLFLGCSQDQSFLKAVSFEVICSGFLSINNTSKNLRALIEIFFHNPKNCAKNLHKFKQFFTVKRCWPQSIIFSRFFNVMDSLKQNATNCYSSGKFPSFFQFSATSIAL